MRKLSLFLFITTFLICTSLSRVTSVSADVTFGSDDVTVVSEHMLDVYRHLALLGSVGDLVSNGVSNFSVSGANSVNGFLDSIFENLAAGLADDNPVSNFGVGVWESLDDFNSYLTDKAYDLMSDFDWYWDSDISDIVDFLSGVSSSKVPYKPNLDALKQFKALSKVSTPTLSPSLDPDFSFLDNIPYLYIRNLEFVQNLSVPWLWNNGGAKSASFNFVRNKVSYFSQSITLRHINLGNDYMHYPHLLILNDILSVNFNTSTLQAEYYGAVPFSGVLFTSQGQSFSGNALSECYKYYGPYNGSNVDYFCPLGSGNVDFNPTTDFSGSGLSTFCNYIYNHFANINVYVDGIPWVIVPNYDEVVIDLDISGLLKMYQSDKPVVYYYPSGTQIDYQALYNVILRALQNGTPVSQTTINEGSVYYDSHDTVYSPTIYNYYSSGDDNEQDFIDDILNLATIPNFDTALVEPLAEPMTNGAAIFGVGVSVFPHDLLLLLGAGFVLVLFVALINRLIE